MSSYLDTGSGDAKRYLGNWLDRMLNSDVISFRAQFGYFTFNALAPYAALLRDLVQVKGHVHFVLGSNNGSLRASDLEEVFKIVTGAVECSLTVVSYANAQFHPKTLHLSRKDGSATIAVGSSNFTVNGLGLNTEATLVLDTRDGDDAATIQQVAEATDRWRGLAEDGIYRIGTSNDIKTLTDSGVINLPQPPRPSVPIARTQPAVKRPAIRTARWRPRIVKMLPGAPQAPAPVATSIPTQSRWCKQLPASDAQQNSGHKIAQLRLTQAGFDIDHRTYFRNEMFGDLTWVPEMKQKHLYEVTHANFVVTFPGKRMGVHSLKIHYAAHQEQSQNNYTSVLYWDNALKQELRNSSYTNFWVVIEKVSLNKYTLTLQAQPPNWHP